jgi:hypothetical protein
MTSSRSCFFLALVVGCSGESFESRSTAATVTDIDSGAAATADAGTSVGASSSGGEGSIDVPGGSFGAGGLPSGGSSGSSSSGGLSGSGGKIGSGGSPPGSGGSSSGGLSGSGGVLGSGGSVACTLVTHDNGLGQTWQDCIPRGTYNRAQATRACEASGASTCLNTFGCVTGEIIVCGYASPNDVPYGCWQYAGGAVGYAKRTNGDCAAYTAPWG